MDDETAFCAAVAPEDPRVVARVLARYADYRRDGMQPAVEAFGEAVAVRFLGRKRQSQE